MIKTPKATHTTLTRFLHSTGRHGPGVARDARSWTILRVQRASRRDRVRAVRDRRDNPAAENTPLGSPSTATPPPTTARAAVATAASAAPRRARHDARAVRAQSRVAAA